MIIRKKIVVNDNILNQNEFDAKTIIKQNDNKQKDVFEIEPELMFLEDCETTKMFDGLENKHKQN